MTKVMVTSPQHKGYFPDDAYIENCRCPICGGEAKLTNIGKHSFECLNPNCLVFTIKFPHI